MKKPVSRQEAIALFVDKYTEEYSKYEQLGELIASVVADELEQEGISVVNITSRAKKPDSVKSKIVRKNYTDFARQIQDLVGVRVVTIYEKDVDRVEDVIRDRFSTVFECLDEESGNKKGSLNTDQFGYLSTHMVVKIKKNRTPPWSTHVGRMAEFQIRTTLQHGWADVSHALAYKGSSMAPTQMRRRLHAISALLEIADNDFERMRDELKELELRYSDAIAAANLEAIGVDALSVSYYLQSTRFEETVPGGMKQVQQLGVDAGMAPWSANASENYDGVALARLALVAGELDLSTLAELDRVLGKALPDMPALLQYFMTDLHARGGQFHADPVDVLTVIISLASKGQAIGRGIRPGFDWSAPGVPRPSDEVLASLRSTIFC